MSLDPAIKAQTTKAHAISGDARGQLSPAIDIKREMTISALPPSALQKIDAHILSFQQVPGALLPLLHAIQDDIGYIPEECYKRISRSLNLSVAEVHGVVSFYHHFRTSPPGRHVLQICRAESCQAMGSAALETYVKSALGVDYHQTTADGCITLEPVYCLGNCACSPAVLFDSDVYGRVDAEQIDSIIAEASSATSKDMV